MRHNPMSIYCWATVYDAGPAINQHRVTAVCLLADDGRALVHHSR